MREDDHKQPVLTLSHRTCTTYICLRDAAARHVGSFLDYLFAETPRLLLAGRRRGTFYEADVRRISAFD